MRQRGFEKGLYLHFTCGRTGGREPGGVKMTNDAGAESAQRSEKGEPALAGPLFLMIHMKDRSKRLPPPRRR